MICSTSAKPEVWRWFGITPKVWNELLAFLFCDLQKDVKFFVYTVLFKSLGQVRFFFNVSESSYAHQGCICLIKKQ